MITEEEARRIARSKRPNWREVKKVIEWATQHPSADKLPYLLLLSTDCRVETLEYDHGLRQARPALKALLACARMDDSHLWRTAEDDWETNRVTCALDGLFLLGADPSRLLTLCQRPLYWGNWGQLRKHLEKVGVGIPDDILRLQTAVENSGGLDNDEYKRRRQAWPQEWNIQAPIPKPVRRPNPEYGSGKGELTKSLQRIEGWLARHAPEKLACLQSGKTPEEIDDNAGRFPLLLPEEIYELYRWRNGAADDSVFQLVPSFQFLSLEQALDLYEMTRDTQTGQKNWFHLASFQSDWTLYATVEDKPRPTAKIREYFVQTPPSKKRADSLTALVAETAELLERGVYLLDKHGWLADTREQ